MSINISSVKAQHNTQHNAIGGHFGLIQPIIIIIEDHEVFNGFSPYNIGFPAALTIRKNYAFAIDLEFVSFIGKTAKSNGIDVHLSEFIIHPGLL